MNKSYRDVTQYNGVSGIYFRKLINTIIEVGDLYRDDIRILDFGAGLGVLKSIVSVKNKNIVNYDKDPDLTEISDWRDCDFDILVANQVFYSFTEYQLLKLLEDIKRINKKSEVVVGISKQSMLNNVGKILCAQPNAHRLTRLNPTEEISILTKYMKIIDQRAVWGLADVYRLQF